MSLILLEELENDNLITLGRGNIISKEEMMQAPGDYPVYSSSATKNGEFGRYGRYMFDDERITWSIDGGGRLFYRDKHKYSVTNVCGWLKVNTEQLLTKYVYYCLHFQWSLLNFDYTYKAHPSVIRKIYKIPMISLAEQEKIVSYLDKINNLIDKNIESLSYYDELIKSRFIEMFGSIEENNKFEIVNIEDVCLFVKDGTHQTPQYTEDSINGFKFLSSKDVMTQKIDWSNIKYIPAELHEKLYATIKPQKNDILMSKNGVNYGVAAVNDTDEIFDIYVSLAIMRPLDIIEPYFFRCVLNSEQTKKQFDSSIKGIGVPNLHLGEIKKTKIILPPMELQKEFVEFVKLIDKSKFSVQKEINLYQELLEKKMNEYFG